MPCKAMGRNMTSSTWPTRSHPSPSSTPVTSVPQSKAWSGFKRSSMFLDARYANPADWAWSWSLSAMYCSPGSTFDALLALFLLLSGLAVGGPWMVATVCRDLVGDLGLPKSEELAGDFGARLPSILPTLSLPPGPILLRANFIRFLGIIQSSLPSTPHCSWRGSKNLTRRFTKPAPAGPPLLSLILTTWPSGKSVFSSKFLNWLKLKEPRPAESSMTSRLQQTSTCMELLSLMSTKNVWSKFAEGPEL
mmetsp:Transcript_36423/g.104754  ORF Transcript_36423/g.104754 Transcript_36423/m.104754 type:complete len:249 (-) Transcript_36423:484-1230(-)